MRNRQACDDNRHRVPHLVAHGGFVVGDAMGEVVTRVAERRQLLFQAMGAESAEGDARRRPRANRGDPTLCRGAT